MFAQMSVAQKDRRCSDTHSIFPTKHKMLQNNWCAQRYRANAFRRNVLAVNRATGVVHNGRRRAVIRKVCNLQRGIKRWESNWPGIWGAGD